MINNSDLQAFIEKIENGAVGVDLMKIGQHYAMQQHNGKLLIYSKNIERSSLTPYIYSSRNSCQQ
jgi:hypothetical protein